MKVWVGVFEKEKCGEFFFLSQVETNCIQFKKYIYFENGE